MDKNLVRIINQTIMESNSEVEHLTERKDCGIITKQGLINAGNLFARLSAEMYMAAGAVKDE